MKDRSPLPYNSSLTRMDFSRNVSPLNNRINNLSLTPSKKP